MLKIRPAELVSNSTQAPAVVLITRRATFAAAHVLRHEGWTDAENQRVFGACSGDHGHNYVLEGTMREAVIAKVDHKHLNRDVDFLEGVIPTAENLALAFWRELEPRLPGGRLERIRLVESENNSVEIRRSGGVIE